MYIEQLELTNFKNHLQAAFNFHEKVNCITGLNGSGKTNLLDAIYFIAFTKSFLGHQDVQCIQFNQNFFVIQAQLNNHQIRQQVRLVQTINEKKQIFFNNNPVKKFSEYIGTVPLIIICPQDILIPAALAEDRRKFIDSFISQYNKFYLQQLLQYNRILEQRNKLLKSFAENNFFDESLIESYNQQLCETGLYIYGQRKRLIEEIKPLFAEHYQSISNNSEEVTFEYESALSSKNMADILINNLQQDLLAQRTTQGIHKDDFLMLINKQLLKKFGSQGQQKSYLIALKLAMYELLKEKKQTKPLLLIDDMMEKLDNKRIERLINLINKDFFGQIFITHTDNALLKNLFKDNDASFFEINSK